uniref:Cyclic 2,3-diphosphoglycerate synthetase n=1 Tax=Candidatus Methanogaster sp. ANME-2c ERB4 TaxID=2759911 RepID=A0A7G9Y1I8_9EURY|nr:cyclic 2,3-diphosphoglycerate synthetase [Methanosarcinales archaeon ANME-2c ERB4]
MSTNPTNVLIMGAAGRDFHNFNVYFRDNPAYHVAAFTATQIPDIEGRTYPAALAGERYPDGIPIYLEDELADLIRSHSIDQVVFAYSDVPYHYVMSKGALVNAAGADFIMQGPDSTMLGSSKPVISVCAVRTGSGKTSVSKKICQILRKLGRTSSVVRHPMPYGNLAKQAVQCFSSYEDLDEMDTTIEEREEYETHIDVGCTVFAGVDYEKILRRAEAEADIVVWDGGNNDFPFFKPDLSIVVADPHRAGDGLTYYPGEINLRMADVVVINKQDTAELENIELVRHNILEVNPDVRIIDSASPITVEHPEIIKGKRVLVVEDGPTLTHGGMKYGAGTIGANKAGAREIIDPRPYTVGTITETFRKYPDTGPLLPAMGYSPKQVSDLEETINNADCDAVVIGTPIDLSRVININKPATRVRYEIIEIGEMTLEMIVREFLERVGA